MVAMVVSDNTLMDTNHNLYYSHKSMLKFMSVNKDFIPLLLIGWQFVASQSEVTLENSWWRHQMETFSALLAICAGNSPVPGEFPTQRPVTRSFDVFFDLRPNKWLSKQSWGWWFETLSCSLWRHRNVLNNMDFKMQIPTTCVFWSSFFK